MEELFDLKDGGGPAAGGGRGGKDAWTGGVDEDEEA